MLALKKHSTTKYFPANLAGGSTPSKCSSPWLSFQPCFVQLQLGCNSSNAELCCSGQGLALCFQSLPLPPCCAGEEKAPRMKDRCH